MSKTCGMHRGNKNRNYVEKFGWTPQGKNPYGIHMDICEGRMKIDLRINKV
jgi:hypothetical protein